MPLSLEVVQIFGARPLEVWFGKQKKRIGLAAMKEVPLHKRQDFAFSLRVQFDQVWIVVSGLLDSNLPL